MPKRRRKLRKLYGKGYNLIVFTNQFAKSLKEKEKRVSRVKTFIQNIGIPVTVFIATGKDKYRKPECGMWNKFSELFPHACAKYYVGDALGRPQDFSDSDKLFAENCGVRYIEPEKVFKQKVPKFETGKQLVVFIGMPGSGKTSFYKKHLKGLGYVHANQDTLKTVAVVKRVTKAAMQEGKPVCLDGTNPALHKRQVFYDLAKTNGYQISIVYFIRDGQGWNKLRTKPVPTIAYHMYFKYLDPPTLENTPGKIYRI
jgi:bifunctional polynucleotide phosphatase/kinase